MEFGIVLRDGSASLAKLTKRPRGSTIKTSQDLFFRHIASFFAPPEDFFPIPADVRFYQWQGDTSVLVIELNPGTRTLRWIKDGQEAYEERTLALPFVILVLPFFRGALQTNICQAFYRRDPLRSWDDPLLMTNFLNVARGYGFTSWVCMVGYQQKPYLSWSEAVEGAIRYFFWSAFNRSSEIHEGNSHYGTIGSQKLDERISSVERWERASWGNPQFMLGIPWPETGQTVRSAVKLADSRLPGQRLNPITLLQSSAEKEGGRNAKT